VAFLRGINNIGTSKRVSMTELRRVFERLGFRDVRTLMNSGNVVFSSPTARHTVVLARIKKELPPKLGFTPLVMVLSGGDVMRTVKDNPFARIANDPSRLLVVVPKESSFRKRLKPLLAKRWGREKLALGRRVAYVWCARGVGESELWPAVDRALEGSCTARNLRTMTKLAKLVSE
jgi:uncharacterized protein (DUF1697 family)